MEVVTVICFWFFFPSNAINNLINYTLPLLKNPIKYNTLSRNLVLHLVFVSIGFDFELPASRKTV